MVATLDNLVRLELRVRVNGRQFVARESIDAHELALMPGGEADFERFVEYFVLTSCGQLARSSPADYRYLRDLVWIVRPDDPHSLKRCQDSPDDPSLTPRCEHGMIVRVTAGSSGVGWRPAGRCPCRCHEADGSAVGARHLAKQFHLADFSEDDL